MPRKPALKISYWTRSTSDFDGIAELEHSLSQTFEVEINRQTDDSLGGWLFQIALEVYNDLSLHEFISGYIQDGIKVGIGLAGRELFVALKRLFDRNEARRPGYSEVRLQFKETQIIVYSTYDGSIEDVLGDVTHELFVRYPELEELAGSTISSIHIPIFHHVEKIAAHPHAQHGHRAFEVEAYRVRLRVDETIRNFDRSAYFRMWGVRCTDSDFLYQLGDHSMTRTDFFTEQEYWKQWEKAYNDAKKH